MNSRNILLLKLIFTSIICTYSDELSNLNNQFIVTYDRARDHLISTTNPLIIFNGDNVIIIHRGQRFEEQVIPKLYHDLKSISHIPLKIYLAIMFDSENLSENNSIELQQYLQDIRLIRNVIQFPPEIQQNQYDIIDLSINYLQVILKTKIVDKIELEKFCQQARILFSINIEIAASAHLDMLDSKIRPWYQDHFNDTERNTLKVVIMGPKTARHGYLAKTYFYKLLGERQEGKHILYAEGADDEQNALAVLGVWLLDAKASESFFDGDAEQLHRDLLADAANVHIKQLFKKSKNEL